MQKFAKLEAQIKQNHFRLLNRISQFLLVRISLFAQPGTFQTVG
jgi:uncharacterized membrane protein